MNLSSPLVRTIGRAVWGALVILAVGLFFVAIPISFDKLYRSGLEYRQGLAELGLSVYFYAAYYSALDVIFMLAFSVVASAIVWHKPGEWLTLFVSFMLVVYGATLPRTVAALVERLPVWGVLVGLLRALSFSAVLVFFYIFPDGRFVPRWTRWAGIVWAAWTLLAFLWPGTPFDPYAQRTWNSPLWFLAYLAWFATGLYAQIYRYLRVATPVQRQQTKWVVFGLVAAVIGTFAVQLPPVIFYHLSDKSTPAGLIYQAVSTTGFVFTTSLVPLSIGISILRYRLFDIDVLIRRGLVYTTLTAALGAAYLGLVTLLQRAFQALAEPSSDLAIFVSTLTIALLFWPLRGRVQKIVDRVFYRSRYDYRLAVQEFGHSLRTIIDIEELLERLVTWLHETMLISHVAVLQEAGPGAPFVTSKAIGTFPGKGQTGRLELARDDLLLAKLRAEEMVENPAPLTAWQTELAVPLISQERLVGVIALGPKLSELPYTGEDKALLSTLADQVAAAIAITRLVQENQEKQRMEQELRLAQDIQMRLLPHEPPQLAGLDIAWFCRPARETSGDFYDYVPLAGEAAGLVVADVTGKGLAAAMVATGARTTVRAEASHAGSPAIALREANNWLCRDMPGGTFVALVYAVVDPTGPRVTLANAGQLTPILQRGGTCQYVRTEGVRWPLGLFPSNVYADCDVPLCPGDTLLLYTDGIVEAMNGSGEMYGFERLEAALVNAPAGGAQDVMEYLVSDVDKFVGATEVHDDMTAVVIRVAAAPCA